MKLKKTIFRRYAGTPTALVVLILLVMQLAAQQDRRQGLRDQVESIRRQGRDAEAVAIAEEALRVATFNPMAAATSANDLVLLYENQRRYSEAEPLFRQMLDFSRTYFKSDPAKIARYENHLANVYVADGKYTEAEEALCDALALDERAFGMVNAQVALDLDGLANVGSALDDYHLTESYLTRALAIRRKILPPDDPLIAATLNTESTDLIRWTVIYGLNNPIVSVSRATVAVDGNGIPTSTGGVQVTIPADTPVVGTTMGFFAGRVYAPSATKYDSEDVTVLFAGYHRQKPKNGLGDYRTIGRVSLHSQIPLAAVGSSGD